jgi:cell division initiation protein
MDSASPHPSTLETLRTVEFRLGIKGYNVDEVDEYLEKAAVEAESLLEQARGAGDRIAQANERIAQLEAELQRVSSGQPATAPAPARAEGGFSDETLQRTLLLAQQTKRDSEAEAAELVQRAEERARTLVAQAEERARQVAGEAEQRLREEVTRLEAMRTRLSAEVEAMSRHLEEERTRIRSSLTELVRWIDDGVGPTGPARPSSEGPEQAAPAAAGRSDAERAAPAPVASQGAGNGAPGADRVPVAAGAPRLRSLSGAPGEELFGQGRRPE